MASIAAKLTIGDYEKWRSVFEKHKSMREDKAGITSEQVYRNADDPKEVLLWFETSDAAKSGQVMQSDEVKAHMKEAGVVGPPKIHVVP